MPFHPPAPRHHRLDRAHLALRRRRSINPGGLHQPPDRGRCRPLGGISGRCAGQRPGRDDRGNFQERTHLAWRTLAQRRQRRDRDAELGRLVQQRTTPRLLRRPHPRKPRTRTISTRAHRHSSGDSENRVSGHAARSHSALGRSATLGVTGSGLRTSPTESAGVWGSPSGIWSAKPSFWPPVGGIGTRERARSA